MTPSCRRQAPGCQIYRNAEGEWECQIHGEFYVPSVAALAEAERRRVPKPKPTDRTQERQQLLEALQSGPQKAGALAMEILGASEEWAQARVRNWIYQLRQGGVEIGWDRRLGYFVGPWRWGSRYSTVEQRVLKALSEHTQGGQELAEKAGTDLEAIWDAVKRLRLKGVAVQTGEKGHGYFLLPADAPF